MPFCQGLRVSGCLSPPAIGLGIFEDIPEYRVSLVSWVVVAFAICLVPNDILFGTQYINVEVIPGLTSQRQDFLLFACFHFDILVYIYQGMARIHVVGYVTFIEMRWLNFLYGS